MVQNLVALTLQEAVGIDEDYLADSAVTNGHRLQLTIPQPLDQQGRDEVDNGGQDLMIPVNSEITGVPRRVSKSTVQRGPDEVEEGSAAPRTRRRSSTNMRERRSSNPAAHR